MKTLGTQLEAEKLLLNSGPVTYTDVSKYLVNFAGYTNWGVYWNTTEDRFEFHAAGTSKAYIDLNDGNISGGVLISTVATGTAPLTVTSTTKVSNLNADMLDGMHAGQSGTNYIPYADASGNVGIGAAPTYGKLEVRTTTSNTGGFTLYTGSGNTARHWINSSDVYLIQRAATDTYGLAIAPTGDVGIGVTTVTEKLEVAGTVKAEGIKVASSGTNKFQIVYNATDNSLDFNYIG